MRALVTVVALASVVAGCARIQAPAPTKATVPTKAAAPTKAPSPVRELDAAAVAELTRAFAANPVAAIDAYRPIRWQVRVNYAADIDRLFGVTEATAVAQHVGQCNIYFRSDADAARVTLNKPFRFQGVLKAWTPEQLNKATFRDATVPP